MQKLIALTLFLGSTLTLTAQNQLKAPNGWEYTILQEGKGQKVTRDNAVEAHMRLNDANGKELFSTYKMGTPDYQLISEVPENYQIAAELMSEGSKFQFNLPMADFKAGLGAGFQGTLPGDHVVWELEILKVLPAKPSIADAVHTTFTKDGADAAFQQFNKYINNDDGSVYISENEVNKVGYGFLQAGKTQEAITIFKYNVKMNLQSANAYDSLGEALAAAGNTQAAIQQYKKSLELNPANENAKQMIAKLEKQ